MQPDNLAALNNQELLQKAKNLKTYKIIDAVLIGFSIGVAVVYTVAKHGVGFFTFFPLMVVWPIIKNSKNNKILENEVQKELKARNL